MNYYIIEYQISGASLQVESSNEGPSYNISKNIGEQLLEYNTGLTATIQHVARSGEIMEISELCISRGAKQNVQAILKCFAPNIVCMVLPETTELKMAVAAGSLHKSEKWLMNAESILKQLANNIGDVLWLRDNHEILYVNQAFKDVWGRDPELLYDDPNVLTEWVHPDDKKNFEPWVNAFQLNTNKAYEEQYRVIKPDGTVRWLWSRMFAIKNSDGVIYRIVGIASDITELKEFEVALKEAKEKAQEMDKLKSVFLANISHEIRTPINGIVGFSELLTKLDLDIPTKESYLDIIKKSSNQLIRIIDDIIDLSKIESNQFKLNIQAVNINKLIDDLFVLFSKYLKDYNKTTIKLIKQTPLDNNNASILSDETRLKQILSNILDNAVKYTPEGHICFGYQIKDSKVEFFVEDTGIGIPEIKQGIIFEHFRQADEGHTRKYGGTGLGLTISKGLVNLLNGEIWFYSKIETGSTFFFNIPYATANKLSAPKIKKDLEGIYDWSQKVILIAEDDKMNYEYLNAILKPTKATLVHAENGSQVLKMCDNLNFHIILMDIRLPILNGLEATRQIREKGMNMPIIAQTAYAYEDDRDKCLKAGCNDYITKPLRKDLLLRMVDKYLMGGSVVSPLI